MHINQFPDVGKPEVIKTLAMSAMLSRFVVATTTKVSVKLLKTALFGNKVTQDEINELRESQGDRIGGPNTGPIPGHTKKNNYN